MKDCHRSAIPVILSCLVWTCGEPRPAEGTIPQRHGWRLAGNQRSPGLGPPLHGIIHNPPLQGQVSSLRMQPKNPGQTRFLDRSRLGLYFGKRVPHRFRSLGSGSVHVNQLRMRPATTSNTFQPCPLSPHQADELNVLQVLKTGFIVIERSPTSLIT